MLMLITLPSNFNGKDFPDNTNSDFIVRLYNYLDIIGTKWEVALLNILYSNNWKSVTEGKIYLEKTNISSKSEKSFILIGNGRYDSVEELKEIIRKRMREMSLDKKVAISYDKVTNTSLLTNSDLDTILSFSKNLAYIFGFELIEKTTYHRGRYNNITSLDINYGLTSLYVYSNTVANRMVGDTNVPLLRVVPVQGKKNTVVYQEFKNPHNVNVASLNSDLIQVLITSDDGERIPFDGGEAVLTVHFIEKKTQ